jgi:hypothetical protein
LLSSSLSIEIFKKFLLTDSALSIICMDWRQLCSL